MPSFLVSYAGPTGRPRTLTIKAADLIEAKKLLRRRSIRANELRAALPENKKTTNQSYTDKNNFSSFSYPCNNSF